MQENKADKIDLNDQVNRLEAMIEALGAGKPIEVRAASPTGPKISDADIDKWNKAAELTLKHQILIDKLCKDVDEVDKLKVRVQNLEKKAADFLTRDEFNPFAQEVKGLSSDMKEAQHDIKTIFAELERLKDKLAGMQYPSVDEFNLLRGRVDKLENALMNMKKALDDMSKKMKNMSVGGGGAD